MLGPNWVLLGTCFGLYVFFVLGFYLGFYMASILPLCGLQIVFI